MNTIYLFTVTFTRPLKLFDRSQYLLERTRKVKFHFTFTSGFRAGQISRSEIPADIDNESQKQHLNSD